VDVAEKFEAMKPVIVRTEEDVTAT
jgi:hypothetical protein